MANINTVVSAAATNTQAEDTTQNPVTTVSTNVPGNHIVHISLRFSGVNVDPNAIYDMIDGTYGTVASVKGTVARNTYIFQIEA